MSVSSASAGGRSKGLVALRGLKRGVQQETGESTAEASAGLPGEGPDADLYRSGSM